MFESSAQPQPHPTLVKKKAKDAQRARRGMGLKEGGPSGVDEPHSSPIRGRARRMDSVDEEYQTFRSGGMRGSIREPTGGGEDQTLRRGRRRGSGSRMSFSEEEDPLFRPGSMRDSVPLTSFRVEHNPPSPASPEFRTRQPSLTPIIDHTEQPMQITQGEDQTVLRGRARRYDSGPRFPVERNPHSPPSPEIPTRQPSLTPTIPLTEHPLQISPPSTQPSFLTQLFEPHVYPHSTSFTLHGIRYGYFPAAHPLPPPPPAHLIDPNAGSATVLTPENVRWTFGQTEQRQRAYAIAKDRRHNMEARKMYANEAKRLYDREAGKIREVIEGKGELPLYTSEEWEGWVRAHGPGVLSSSLDS